MLVGGLGNLFPGRTAFDKNIHRRVFIRDERFLMWTSAREFLSGTNGFLSFFSFGFFGLFLWLLDFWIFGLFLFFFGSVVNHIILFCRRPTRLKPLDGILVIRTGRVTAL